MSYVEVVNLIKAKKQEDDLQLLVADRATIQWYKNQRVPISSQVVPKMQYIETLLNEELQQLSSQDQDMDHQPQTQHISTECKLLDSRMNWFRVLSLNFLLI